MALRRRDPIPLEIDIDRRPDGARTAVRSLAAEDLTENGLQAPREQGVALGAGMEAVQGQGWHDAVVEVLDQPNPFTPRDVAETLPVGVADARPATPIER
jgi:hypothetical protein